ncbi:hypothetical protein Pan97_10640 [Bremerella volcania]|uniref:Uncharacterized protein n=1 Tax=Bremerella volcania TaxID=2527984 RepID=A0A518C4B1_9BACT|nr:hypothetical protein [Bremerella volcania]QDU74060.1 hypothetical protein Pan97_10640 [Bremerella volcania]
MKEKPEDQDLRFLKTFLASQQEAYDIVPELCDPDFFNEDTRPQTSDDEERCARIAESLGFDGSLFRNLFKLDELSWLRQTSKRIKTIPQLISKIESRRMQRMAQDEQSPALPKPSALETPPNALENKEPARHDSKPVDADHLAILRFLSKSKDPMLQKEIRRAIWRGERTARSKIQDLVRYEFVKLPFGKNSRRGYIITPDGRQLLDLPASAA